MSSPINFTETAAKAQEKKREAAMLASALASMQVKESRLARFWRWLNTPLWKGK